MEPSLMFAGRVGPVRKAYAKIPTRLFDGKWIWLKPYRWALYATKPHLQGPHMQHRVKWDADPLGVNEGLSQ